ncbi:MAG: hypothetical protein JWR04_1222 [Rhodoglobus sp.]|nr:hypothetical protein [Rhodoglobus sp.]
MAEHRSSIDIEAPPERVFEFLITEDGMTQWMGTRASLEPVPGGAFAVDIAGYRARGSFLEVDPYRRVTVTWGFVESAELPPGASTVSFELTPTAAGTHLEVVHTDLPDSEVTGHAAGWANFLPRLGLAATDHRPPVDTWTPRAEGATT